MKILWIVNTIFPYPAEKLGIEKTAFGGWLNSLSNTIKENENFTLAIASTYKGKRLLEFYDGKITYFLIPGAPALKYSKKREKIWKEVNEKFKPDIVHINGTEYAQGLEVINACQDAKILTSIQGLLSVYANSYYGNIPVKDILKNITFRDIIKRDSIIQGRKKFIKRGKTELEIIKKSNAISGRTIWDYSNVKAINPVAKFYSSNRILRKGFYESEKWNIENIERHSIFCSQASYPIKGLHYMLEAINILKNEYPDIKVYVAGLNILADKSLKEKIKMTGYAKYLKKLIKQYDLIKNIVFTGILKEEDMIKRLLKSHVFVQTSSIENSPNSLGEAMILGVPSIASYVGGTCNMLEHEKEGYLYTYTEPAILAEYLRRIFENDSKTIEISKNAIKKATDTHNSERITKENIDMYIDIYNK